MIYGTIASRKAERRSTVGLQRQNSESRAAYQHLVLCELPCGNSGGNRSPEGRDNGVVSGGSKYLHPQESSFAQIILKEAAAPLA